MKDAFQNDFYIGAALNVGQITGLEPEAIDIVARHFNSITPENIMKWEEIHPEPGRYNFEISDQFVAFGEKHNMHIIGHALVWHEQTPEWVYRDDSGNLLGREALLERMKDHIFTVVGRYKGRIHGWDVVNEAVMKDGSMRKSKWFDIIGEDFVQRAFEYAREADPDTELYYNEYEYEYDTKTDGVIRLVENLQSNGVRVDGVGIQGHWLLDYPEMELIDSYVSKLRKLGVNLMVTEMDVGVVPFCPPASPVEHISSFDTEKQKAFNPYPEVLPDNIQEELAQRYVEFFSYFKKNRDIFSRITLWAVHDGQTWRNYWPIKGRADHPMLFDRQCRPKPALEAIIRLAE